MVDLADLSSQTMFLDPLSVNNDVTLRARPPSHLGVSVTNFVFFRTFLSWVTSLVLHNTLA